MVGPSGLHTRVFSVLYYCGEIFCFATAFAENSRLTSRLQRVAACRDAIFSKSLPHKKDRVQLVKDAVP